MNLRPYQREALDATREALLRSSSTLIVHATGLGKTVEFAHMIREQLATRGQSGGRCMVLAHRHELLQQAGEKIKSICGVEYEVEKAGSFADRQSSGLFIWKAPVILTSVQTQTASYNGEKRMRRFDPMDFERLFVDEAHHATSDTWREVIDYYRQNPKLKVVGFTATPNRHDEAALGEVFETVAHEFGILDGIMGGWLVDIEQQTVIVDSLDLSRVGTSCGDLNGKELAQVMEYEETLHGVVDPAIKISGNRKMLVFAASVAHAERMTEIFNRHDPGSAGFVCGTTDPEERKETIARFRSGDLRRLCNCGIATEGFDVPDIEVVAIARPTKSLPFYTQMIGRGTRVLTELDVDQFESANDRVAAIEASTKPNLLVLDFIGQAGKHKLINVVDALGGNYSEAALDMAKDHLREDLEPRNIRKELDEAEARERTAETEARASRSEEEERRRRGLRPDVEYQIKKVNPFDVLEVSTSREPGWHKGRLPSPAMVRALENFKIPDADKMTWYGAKRLIGALCERADKKGCTYPQSVQLKKRGFPSDCTFSQARTWMDEIANSGWTLRFPAWCKKEGNHADKYDAIEKEGAQ